MTVNRLRVTTALLLSTVVLAGCSGGFGEPAIVTSVAGVDVPLSTRDASRVARRSSEIDKVSHALSELERHAAAGDEAARTTLLSLYSRGTSVLLPQPQKEVALRQALYQSGDESQIDPLIAIYLDTENPAYDLEAAAALLEIKANAGDTRAAAQLARLFSRPDSPLADPIRAVSFDESLAANGDINARRRLAIALVDPDNPAYDPDRGVVLLQELIADGNGDAAQRLGRLYQRGEGVERNPEEAVRLYEQGMLLGSDVATLRFAAAMQRGIGTEQNEVRAIQLYADLARNGSIPGRLALARTAPDIYTSIVQQELTDRGAYTGPITGIADASTLIAFSSWCGEQGIIDACETGFLEADAVREFARQL